MKLTAENVEEVGLECMSEEVTDKITMGQGVIHKIGFLTEKLNTRKEDIKSMLSQLPKEFMEDGGGGWSFLNMCNDKDGNQWTGLHKTMELLVALGNAIGCISFPMPKEMWSILPGGVPYISVKGVHNEI